MPNPIIETNIKERTEQIMEYVCDNLCKYPSEYKDPDDLWNKQCDHCRLIELLSDFRDCRNELCLKCGSYKQKHLGACDGCRWKECGNG